MSSRTKRIIDKIVKAKVLNPSLVYIAVHGITPKGECTCGKNHSDVKEKGKHPVFAKWQETATNETSIILGWFETNEDFNLGLVCKESGVLVIDVDPRSNGHKSLPRLEELSQHSLEKTVTAKTGLYKIGGQSLRGTHYIYRCDPSEKFFANLSKQDMPGIDIKHNGYIVLDESRHFSGVDYCWEEGLSPADIEIAPAPEELLAVLRSKSKNAQEFTKSSSFDLEPFPWAEFAQGFKASTRMDLPTKLKEGLVEGERAVEIYRIACSLAVKFGTDALARDFILNYLIRWNRELIKPPMEETGPNSLSMHVNRALDFVAQNPLDFSQGQDSDGTTAKLMDTTDASVVEWLAELFADKLCWSKTKAWLNFEAGVWNAISDEKVREILRSHLLDYCMKLRTNPETSHIAQTLRLVLSATKIKNYEALLRGALEVDDESLNSHPDLLNVKNGVVDLKSGELLPHDPKLLFTQISPTEYAKNAQHPDWAKALTAIPESSIDWVHVFLGQACTGHTAREDLMVVFSGGGRNGKSTILSVAKTVLGPHAVQVSDRILSARDGDHTTDLMDLQGKRLAILEEYSGASLNTKRLKDIVGTSSITARRMRQDNQTFGATHTFVLTTNIEPQIDSGDDGTWRRLVKITFPFRYVQEPKLKNDRQVIYGLRERIQEGLEGQHQAALAWLVKGAMLWYANDKKLLDLPKSILEATSDWRLSQDGLGAFLSENLELQPGSHVAQDDLLRLFNSQHVKELDPDRKPTSISQLRSHEFFQVNGLKFERLRHASLELSRPSGILSDLPPQTTLIRGLRFKK